MDWDHSLSLLPPSLFSVSSFPLFSLFPSFFLLFHYPLTPLILFLLLSLSPLALIPPLSLPPFYCSFLLSLRTLKENCLTWSFSVFFIFLARITFIIWYKYGPPLHSCLKKNISSTGKNLWPCLERE